MSGESVMNDAPALKKESHFRMLLGLRENPPQSRKMADIAGHQERWIDSIDYEVVAVMSIAEQISDEMKWVSSGEKPRFTQNDIQDLADNLKELCLSVCEGLAVVRENNRKIHGKVSIMKEFVGVVEQGEAGLSVQAFRVSQQLR